MSSAAPQEEEDTFIPFESEDKQMQIIKRILELKLTLKIQKS